ncbi:MAG TPA: HAMP domain-containing sensor histidine kinase [Opitutaceae bacterium]|nr:HAMP domain-containing sensor histidine kinase [Opitutaceae bacterium]
MSPTSRRIVLYWLLLLVPTLLVGGGAILLLRREQARLAERGAQATESRRAAIAARARLTAETVELLVGDVQTGLLDSLAAEQAVGIDDFLAQWEKSQPLVRSAFRASLDGRLLRPTLGNADEDARGFMRRFPRLLAGSVPWTVAKETAAAPANEREKKLQLEEPMARQEVALNVAQVQSARRDVQELFKNRGDYGANAPASAAASAPPGASAGAAPSRVSAAESRSAEADRIASRDPTTARSKVAVQGKTDAVALNDISPERRGWLPRVIDGRMHLLGWVQPAGLNEVRGVEVELAALISRLGGALPAEPGAGEGYALLDEQGRVLHQAGAVSRPGAPYERGARSIVERVPFAASLLPDWSVNAYLTLPEEYRSGNGTLLWLSVLLTGIFVAAILAGGSLLVRQARRSEEEAVQKTSFVANVSHEFKTPLTTIRLYAELLEQGRVRDAAQGSEYLRTIGRETQRLARLVNNALDFSRLEQGRKKFARENVELGADVGRLLDTQGPRLAECGLQLKRALPAAPLNVTTDRDALEQIVLNLLDNACKYAAIGGEVTVTVRARDGGAEVSVADRGPGVPPEHRERIFEKFHRVDDKLTAEKTGAGLGLSIARQLARGLGGELRHAPRDGGGAEFILELP